MSDDGVAPDSEIVAIKVLDNTNTFYFFSEIVAALDYVLNNQPSVRVVNMSLGTNALFAGDCDAANANAMAGAAAVMCFRTRNPNPVISFAASGNDSSGTMMALPACLSNVVSVGATTKGDVVAGFTNSNAKLDLMAPGVNITSTGLNNGTATDSGTSFASPHAAGCAALLLESNPNLTPAEIEARLEASALQVTDPKNNLTFPRLSCNALDHFKCYKIKKDNIVFSQTASQVDQFGSNNAELKKAFLWCNPVNKNGEGIANNVDHLLCYKVKGLKLDPPPHIQTSNQFGVSTLFAKKPSSCVFREQDADSVSGAEIRIDSLVNREGTAMPSR